MITFSFIRPRPIVIIRLYLRKTVWRILRLKNGETSKYQKSNQFKSKYFMGQLANPGYRVLKTAVIRAYIYIMLHAEHHIHILQDETLKDNTRQVSSKWHKILDEFDRISFQEAETCRLVERRHLIIDILFYSHTRTHTQLFSFIHLLAITNKT